MASNNSSSDAMAEVCKTLSKAEYAECIKWKVGTLRPKAESRDTPKTAAEILKRIVVGFMILAWYVSPMYVHPLAV